MPESGKSHALDHVVVVLFENRSLDNVLGHLYGPEAASRVDVLTEAAERGFTLEERPLRGQWVRGWRRGDDTRHPAS
jgi:phospholipase C